MSMPLHYVLVRHGESEANVAIDNSNEGNRDYVLQHQHRIERLTRLTPLGEQQAKASGKWIKKYVVDSILPNGFDRHLISPYVRAIETAANLDLPNAVWRESLLVRERDWGDIELVTFKELQSAYPANHLKSQREPLFWRPPGGESIAQMTESRIRELFDMFHRELSDKSVIVVTHGEFIWGNRLALEHPTVDEWTAMVQNKEQPIRNGQVFHYSRVNPKTGEIADKITWLRTVDPYNNPNDPGVWSEIEPREYSNAKLIKFVNKFPRLFEASK